MKVKEIWTDKDFEEMGWHDCHIYSINFSNDNLNMILDIDYLFEWVINEDSGLYNFWISPCYLGFYNLSNFQMNFQYDNCVAFDIMGLKRKLHISSYNNSIYYNYEIETDIGNMSFDATHFIQKVREQPILSKSQILERPKIM